MCPRDCGVGQLSRATRSGSRARGFDQLSRANHARVRWPTGFIISPARLKHVLRARGVYQVPRATLARVLGPTGSTSCRGNLALGSEGPQGLPAVPGDPGPCPRARSRPSVPGGLGPGRTYRGFDQASRVTRARVRSPRGRPALPGDWGPGPKPSGSTSCPGRLALEYECPQGRPAQPGDSGRGSIARGVDQLFRVFEGPLGQPAVPRDSGLFPKAGSVDQLSREPWDLIRGPAVLTSLPGRLRPLPEGPRRPPALPGNSKPCPRAWVSKSCPR